MFGNKGKDKTEKSPLIIQSDEEQVYDAPVIVGRVEERETDEEQTVGGTRGLMMADNDAPAPKTGLVGWAQRNPKKTAVGVLLGVAIIAASAYGIYKLVDYLKPSEPSPTPTPEKDKFSKSTAVVSNYERVLAIKNEGTEDQSFSAFEFTTNTNLTGTATPGLTLFTKQRPDGFYDYTLNATTPILVKAGETLQLLDYTAHPKDQTGEGNFPYAVAINAVNATLTTTDGQKLVLSTTGATHPVAQPFPVRVAFSRDQATENNFPQNAPKGITGARENTFIFLKEKGIIYSTWIEEENKKLSLIQTYTETSGNDISWGLVGNCQNDPNQINWNNFIPNPALSNTTTQNIAEGLASYGKHTPFVSVTIDIDMLSCTLNPADVISYMQALRAKVGPGTKIYFVTPITGPANDSIIAALKANNIDLIINTAGGSAATLQTTAQNLIAKGFASSAISVGIPAGTDATLIEAYANVSKTLKLTGGVEVINGLQANAQATIDKVNQLLNPGHALDSDVEAKPRRVRNNALKAHAAETAKELDKTLELGSGVMDRPEARASVNIAPRETFHQPSMQSGQQPAPAIVGQQVLRLNK